MTFENKIVVGLDDIKAVIFECRNCQTRVSVKPDKLRIPCRCPHCGDPWKSEIVGSVTAEMSPYARFCTALTQCIAPQHGAAPFTILLEFEGET
jgi:hypothetical protein